jgi:predicted site-specific integrase-resolvase
MKRKNKNDVAWTVAQAARAWGMSESALRRRMRSGHIETAACSGGALRIEAATVHSLLAARWCCREDGKRRRIVREVAL